MALSKKMYECIKDYDYELNNSDILCDTSNLVIYFVFNEPDDILVLD